MSEQIQLTHGKIALVDNEDFERINAHKWYAHLNHTNGKLYAARGVGTKPFTKIIYMHREIMNASSGTQVDHVRSEDTLDNRHSNLRFCTTSQNGQNRGAQKNNKSGFKGVYWAIKSKKWEASIHVSKKTIHLGFYNTAEDAARAYDKVVKEYHGEFARTNF